MVLSVGLPCLTWPPEFPLTSCIRIQVEGVQYYVASITRSPAHSGRGLIWTAILETYIDVINYE